MARPSQQIQPDQLADITIEAPVLYRCFDDHDELLYIGFTSTPEKRFKQHRSKSWWSSVNHITMHSYRSVKVLEQDEVKAIREERPKFNKTRQQIPGMRSLLCGGTRRPLRFLLWGWRTARRFRRRWRLELRRSRWMRPATRKPRRRECESC